MNEPTDKNPIKQIELPSRVRLEEAKASALEQHNRMIAHNRRDTRVLGDNNPGWAAVVTETADNTEYLERLAGLEARLNRAEADLAIALQNGYTIIAQYPLDHAQGITLILYSNRLKAFDE